MTDSGIGISSVGLSELEKLEQYREQLQLKKTELDKVRGKAYTLAASGNIQQTQELTKYLEELGLNLQIDVSEDIIQIKRNLKRNVKFVDVCEA